MTGLLASVRDPEEAALALAAGAAIIDCKDPSGGALGALAPAAVADIVAVAAGRRPVSATVGDLPFELTALAPAIQSLDATGVDFVKLGLFCREMPGPELLSAVVGSAPRHRLVAVLLADLQPDFEVISALSAAGFAGVMLDTADKSSGNLLEHLSLDELDRFVRLSRGYGLLVGLAGSLKSAQIPALRTLGPDYLGFRGALCHGGRTAGLCPDALKATLAALGGEGPAHERDSVPVRAHSFALFSAH